MKHAYLLNLLQPLATLASGIGKRKKLLIMIYHRVLDEPDFMRPSEVDKVAFTWHMQLLAKHFNVLPLVEALERMKNDTLPPRAVCITFDDGYADNYTNALPILQRFNLKATFFIASGFLDGGRMWNDTIIEAIRNLKTWMLNLQELGLGEFDTANSGQKYLAAEQIIIKIKHLSYEDRSQCVDYIASKAQDLPNNLMMTSEQLKKLYQSGMEIGGHTINHPILEKIDNQTAEREITENKTFLEELLQTKIKYFAYPNGRPIEDYNLQHVELVRKICYQAAVTTQWGVSDLKTDKYQLPRFTPWDRSELPFMLRMITISCKSSV